MKYYHNLKTIIVDIDDTLISGEFDDNALTYNHISTNQAVVDFVNEADNIFVLTGRNQSLKGDTEALLSSIGLRYNRLFMNPNHYSLSNDHKDYWASLLSVTHKVDLAIDDNEEVRDIYASYGIRTLDPALILDKPIDLFDQQIAFQD
jgi:hypothetical protein